MPAVLHGVVLGFEWSRERLWELDLPVQWVAMSELRWLLSLPVWAFEGVPFVVSPRHVRADPDRYSVQYGRTMAADLAFPLHVLARRERVATVLDGFHRLLKAELLGMDEVAVKKVPEACLDMIACPASDCLPVVGSQAFPRQPRATQPPGSGA